MRDGRDVTPRPRPSVVVVIPVLGRPHAAAPLIRSLEATSDARPVFVCSPGDDPQIDACRATSAETLILDQPVGPGDFARKMNHAYRHTDSEFLFQAADDVTFQPGWLDHAIAAIDADGGYGVCGTWDGANPVVMRGQHSTHSLIRRGYVDECGASWDGPGSVFSEAYAHQWCDTELVELAKLRDCFTFARDARVLHRHPFYDRTAKRDATYERGLAAGAADREVFRARQREWLREMAAA